ncbi:glycoside hydrolase family 5 protein [Pleurotus ostreatus PC15]|uniref:mannan endo-1,4-beta-mannosidase n=1 Tax=Pleurotus ostreatus (strain PC15) TaxID=1137138 RepID=A0A067NU02_PLEO1|nr:glycoside hydrolase family 5 protein [Pleurotus ostreatus PC15]
MKLAAGLVALAVALTSVKADVAEWGQCGGINWSGETTCAAGLVCHSYSDWYFQCIKGTSSAQPTVTSVTPTTTSLTPTPSVTPPTSTGFVKTSGTEFTLDGSKFTVVGSNSYWVGLSGFSSEEMSHAFADVAAAGGTTVRTWGFNDQTDAGYWGPYYQLWTNGVPTVNTGASGLENFDKVVAAAKANGIRLIVALTNNWSDYGGMDVYVQQITGSTNHDLFYTDAQVIAAYKNYVQTFVSRYANEPTILAWELANEPRCRGSGPNTSGTCTPATITAWATDISTFIKSIDPNHLVALGDEGFFNRPGSPTYPYQGSEGIDFDANLQISTLDFGTIHVRLDHWGTGADALAWGSGWITDHATSSSLYNKPVILEEFGMLEDKTTIYAAWFDTIESSGFSGDLIWFVPIRVPPFCTYSWGDTHNDGYAIYPGDAVYDLMASHAATLKARP